MPFTPLVGYSTRPGEIILDPFAGSGSTLIAARDMGRRAIGIEINLEFCDAAIARLRQGSFAFNESTEATP